MLTPPVNVGAEPAGPLTVEDGATRIVLFRAWPEVRRSGKPPSESGADRRVVAGVIGIYYAGQLAESVDAVKRFAAEHHGPGRYKIVLQRKISGRWLYLGGAVTSV